MKFAVNVPNFGTFADPIFFRDLAVATEAGGWDGLFIWDHILTTRDLPVADPWILLAAAATATHRIRLGPMVTPLPRRRPWKVARETVTLDHLSGGRVMLGVGIGDDWMGEFSALGEPQSDVQRGEMLDEGLTVLDGLWRGEPFSFNGKHYKLRDVQFLPRPVQKPRIPILVAGRWPNPRPFRRAARWDGVVPVGRVGILTPDDCRSIVETVQAARETSDPFEVMVVKSWIPDSTEKCRAAAEFASAGATWMQFGFPQSSPPEDVLDAVRSGPPKVDGGQA